jgi:X-X-X-Leu-X-X-Gly heptad repeat protein
MSGSAARRRVLPIVGVSLALALVLLGVRLAVPPSTPAAAPTDGPALENTELVLAELEPTGLPIQAQLVSAVTSRGGDERVVQDPASTVNVGYLNRRGSPQTGDGVVLLEVGGPGTTRAVTEATFDRPLPVALHAEYTLDGEVVPPGEVLGVSGRLGVRYTVTNTTAQQETVVFRDAAGETVRRQAPVFVPLAGTMDVLLPDGLDVIDAPGAVRTTDEAGRTVLRYSLLLAPPLGQFQTDVAVLLRATDGATPRVTLAVEPATSDTDVSVEFSAEALAGAADGNTELAEGLREIGEQTGALAGGAAAVSDGAGALADGAGDLAAGVAGPLLEGSRQLDDGAAQLASGADALNAGFGEAAASAGQLVAALEALSDGVADLSSGLDVLGSDDGLAQATTAAKQLAAAGNQIVDGVGSADDPPWPDLLPDPPTVPDDATPQEIADLVEQYLVDVAQRTQSLPDPTLVQSVRFLEQATTLLAKVAGVLVASVEEQKTALAEAKASAASASDEAAALFDEVCATPPTLSADQCARLDDVGVQADAATRAVRTAEQSAAAQWLLGRALGLGVGGVGQALVLLEVAVADLSTALRSGDTSSPGLVEGLDLLESGLVQSLDAVGALQRGADVAESGSAELAAGGAALVDGVAAAASGVGSLSDGADALAAGAAANVDGVQDLAVGAGDLAAGARQAADASADVAAGVATLRDEGIDPVAEAVAQAVDDPAFAAAWIAANDARAADALPYGAPEGAVGHVAYRLTMPATSASGTPAWQWWLLAAVGVGLVGLVARRRLIQE